MSDEQFEADVKEFTKKLAKLIWAFPEDNSDGEYAYSRDEYREYCRNHVAKVAPGLTYAEYLEKK